MNNTQLIRPRTIIVAVVIVIVIVVTYLILSTPAYRSFSFHATPFSASSYSAIQGDAVYSYSGMSFYKQDIQSGKDITVLNNGLRLPTIQKLYWGGDSGALLTFSDGGYIGSIVEQELSARNLEWNEDTDAYLWYLDFETSKLSLVSTFSPISEHVYYSAKTQSFYYVRDNGYLPESDALNGTPLATYSVESLRETVLYDEPSNISTRFVGICPNEEICFTQVGDEGEALYTLRASKKVRLTTETFDTIIPTGNPAVFIGTKHDDVSEEATGEDGILAATSYYIDLASKKTYKTGAVLKATKSLLANTSSDDSFYIVEPSPGSTGDVKYFTGGKNILGSFKAKQATFKDSEASEQTSRSIVGPISQNSNGLTMFSDVNGATYLVTPEGYSFDIRAQDKNEVTQALKVCFDRYVKDYDYSDELKQFKIGVTYDQSFQQTIKNFALCTSKTNPSSIVGYSFVFIGLSTSDGRYVTD